MDFLGRERDFHAILGQDAELLGNATCLAPRDGDKLIIDQRSRKLFRPEIVNAANKICGRQLDW